MLTLQFDQLIFNYRYLILRKVFSLLAINKLIEQKIAF